MSSYRVTYALTYRVSWRNARVLLNGEPSAVAPGIAPVMRFNVAANSQLLAALEDF